MAWFRRIDPTIKEMILKQAKEDHRPIAEISAEFGVHVKTIYAWLGSEVSGTGKTDSQYLAEIHKLQREKEDLLKIVWAMTVVVNRLKKKDEEDRLRSRASPRKYWPK
jgi:transposase-like protein